MKHDEISDDDAVRRLLDEAEVAPSNRLTSSLLAFRSAGQDVPAPEPSPELMAFMKPSAVAPAVAPVVPLRRRRNVRGALMVTAALAGTGLGITGVAAANPDFRSAADQAVQNVVGFFAPSGQAEAPDQAEPGVPAGGPAAPGQGQANNSGSGAETGTGSDKDDLGEGDADSAPASADPAAPGKSLAPGQQPERPDDGNRSGNGERNAEHAPPPVYDVLPATPPIDGTLPGPIRPDRPHDKSGKDLPLPDGTLPSDDPARIPELPVVPELQR